MKSKKTWQTIFLALCVPVSVWALTNVVDLPAPSFTQKRSSIPHGSPLDDAKDQFSPAALLGDTPRKKATSPQVLSANGDNTQPSPLVRELDVDSDTNSLKSNTPEQADAVYSPVEKFKLTDRPMTDKQLSAVYQDLLRPSEAYPYEFDQELYDLSQKIKSGNISPLEMEKFFELSSTYPERNTKKSADVAADPDRAYGLFTGQPFVSGRSRPSNKSAIYASSRVSIDPAELRDDVEYSDLSTAFRSGYAQEFEAVAYTGKVHNPIPDHLQFTHQHLRIHHAIKGQRPNAFMQLISKIAPPVYLNEPSLEPLMHQKYRIGPDWNTHWVFEGAQKSLLEQAGEQYVITLGKGGSIVFEVTNGEIVNDDGPDFVIWSNPFCYVANEKTRADIKDELKKYHYDFTPFDGNAKSAIAEGVSCFTELAKVEVSETGKENTYVPFGPCQANESMRASCAGYGFNLWHQSQESKDPFNPASGGDRFDLDDVGLKAINFIRITDLNVPPPISIPKEERRGYIENGFDLDAIAILHYQGD